MPNESDAQVVANEPDELEDMMGKEEYALPTLIVDVIIDMHNAQHSIMEIYNFLNYRNDGTWIWQNMEAAAVLTTVSFISDVLCLAGFYAEADVNNAKP